VKNVEEILDTAFIIMMISDRGLLERESHEGGIYSFKEREDKRLKFLEILKSRNLYEKLSQKEVGIVSARVGTLSKDNFILSQMQYEAIPVLLWAVGIKAFPKYDGKLCYVDFHLTLGKYRTDQTKIEKKHLSLDWQKINWWRNISFLWHWRAREGGANPTIKKKDIVETIVEIFGEEYEKYFTDIPIQKKWPRDFLVNGKEFNRLNENSIKVLLLQSKWRHHAFEWMSSNVSWEETDTST